MDGYVFHHAEQELLKGRRYGMGWLAFHRADIVFDYFRAPENIYEDVPGDSHMGTMDVRIKVTADIMKDSDAFSDIFSELLNGKSEKANDNSKVGATLKANSDIFSKAKGFKKKCLARISSM